MVLVGLNYRLYKGAMFLRVGRNFSRVFLFFGLEYGLLYFSFASSFSLHGSFQLFFGGTRDVLFGLFRSSTDRYHARAFRYSKTGVSFGEGGVLQLFCFVVEGLRLLAMGVVVRVFSLGFGRFSFVGVIRASRTYRFAVVVFGVRCYVPVVEVSVCGVARVPYGYFRAFSSLFLCLFLVCVRGGNIFLLCAPLMVRSSSLEA